MTHLKHISREAAPALASSLLETQQKVGIGASIATAVNTLAGAFNTYTQGDKTKTATHSGSSSS